MEKLILRSTEHVLGDFGGQHFNKTLFPLKEQSDILGNPLLIFLVAPDQEIVPQTTHCKTATWHILHVGFCTK